MTRVRLIWSRKSIDANVAVIGGPLILPHFPKTQPRLTFQQIQNKKQV